MSRSKSWIAVIAITVAVATLAAVALPSEGRGHQPQEQADLRQARRCARTTIGSRPPRPPLRRRPPPPTPASPSWIPPSPRRRPRLPTPEATPTPDATPTPEATPTPDTTPAAVATPVAVAATPTVEELKARVAKARRAVRIWKLRVYRLARQYRFRLRMAEWERRGQWMPIIRVAAARYHVSAGGMYRMMMRESGGQRYAGSSSAFKGLFQYHTGTWAAGWNPYRHDSIYDGSSQIFATAYAISRGMGRQMWTTTFASQY